VDNVLWNGGVSVDVPDSASDYFKGLRDVLHAAGADPEVDCTAMPVVGKKVEAFIFVFRILVDDFTHRVTMASCTV